MLSRFFILARDRLLRRGPIVTHVKLEGVLTSSKGQVPTRGTINFEKASKWLKLAFDTSYKQKAVAVSINSPGGSAGQAELIHRMIRSEAKRAKLPVYTFAEDVAASGGYWLMCAGDEMYSLDTSILGSIGVVSSSFGLKNVLDSWKVERRLHTAGKAKAEMDPFSDVTPEQIGRLKEILDDLHDTFIKLVKDSREDKLKGKDDELFSGRVWAGHKAHEIGLVDGVADAHTFLRQKYGEKVRVITFGERRGIFGNISVGQNGTSRLMTGGYSPQDFVAALLDEVELRHQWARFRM